MSRSAISRGTLLSVVTSGGRALADIAMFSGETRSRVELMMPYGLSALPGKGADVLVHEIGSRDHLVAVMADDPSVRILGLAPGEVGIQAFGQRVVIRADGVEIGGAKKISIVSDGPVTVTAPQVVVESPNIRLGSAGAAVPVQLANNSAATKVFAE